MREDERETGWEWDLESPREGGAEGELGVDTADRVKSGY